MSNIDAGSIEVLLEFSGQPSAAKRDLARESITSLATRSEHASAARRTAQAAVERLMSRAAEPNLELTESDPAVAAALAAAQDEQRDLLASVDFGPPDRPLPESVIRDGRSSDSSGVADEIHAVPYDFSWRWHGGRPPLESTADLATGRAKLWVQGKYSEPHAGFGVFLSTDHDHWVTARSLRRSRESYRVWETAGWALFECGTEMTVFEDGVLVGSLSRRDRRVRKRVSHGFFGEPESDSYDSGGFGTGAPMEATWLMRAGHGYTLNVGAYAISDWDSGPGASGTTGNAIGTMAADVLAMTLFHH